ncbi:hypothetical protein DNTS_011331 [Danionella cerebrum]|uniref:THAP-type domain-containing protein n=1 Tax=Danionella cerebrum TaxID=2873325 RepID=A0A553MRY8_9TELE|nr:hypothetical protein DNTS_011331 [Danionella translucida]TRY55944.1 hypothetical protein DNTS_011331 [Danionella translucida]
MVKCAVRGCVNHSDDRLGEHPGRPPKRFFNFPKDQAQVKVWLAALRQTEQEITEQHEICEDHFLSRHITSSGISPDAIPVMPPLEAPLDGWIACDDELPGGAEESAVAVEGESDDDEDDFEDDDDNEDHNTTEKGSYSGVSKTEDTNRRHTISKSSIDPGNKDASAAIKVPVPIRSEVALGGLTKKFVQLLEMAPNRELDLNEAAQKLGTRKRRVYDITNVLTGIQLIKKTSKSKIKWVCQTPLSSFGNRRTAQVKANLINLKLTEEALDWLIKDCAQQLFAVTDHKDYAEYPLRFLIDSYVTYEDICHIDVFKDQTVIAVRAPQETKLEVPPPTEESVQIHLKACRGPIHILTSDTEDPGDEASVPSKLKSDCFLALEDSRIPTRPLVSDVSSTATAVQSA